MKLSQSLLLKLSKRYEPSSLVDMKYKGEDICVKTDEEGNPVILFIGKALTNGKIKGERYTRTLKRDTNGIYKGSLGPEGQVIVTPCMVACSWKA